MALFKCLGSIQILNFPGFTTVTIEETQSVGLLTGAITPSCCIRSNSSFAWERSANGIRGEGLRQQDLLSGQSVCGAYQEVFLAH